MSFNAIKDQDMAVTFLKNAIALERIANAYIFYGPDGVGKKLAALNFAKALNCTAVEGCDACPSCKKIDSMNHPDVRLITPGKEGGSIGIDEIRSVIKDAGLKPYEARKKVYIIDEADTLTEEAANALLKTLEEPSANATLILIVQGLGGLPPTIRSRCQVVKFFTLDSIVIKELLVAHHGVDVVKAHVLAALACGRMSQALRFKDAKFFDKRERIIDALASNTLADWDFDKTAKADLKMQLDIMLTWYRDILVTRSGEETVVNIDRMDSISAHAKRADVKKLDSTIKEIISTQSYLDMNANPKLAMAALGMKL